MAQILDVSDATFETEVLKSDRPVIVDFWAEWCAPCRAIAPIIKELASEYGDRIKIAKMNIDESPQTPGSFRVQSIPTVLAFRDGQVVEQMVGARPKAAFKEMVERLL
jgi:thioredoxin 1